MERKGILLLISSVVLATTDAACWRGGLFECTNQQKCLENSRVCNGYADCNDNSDESDCTDEKCNGLLAYYETVFTEFEKEHSDVKAMLSPRFACTDGLKCIALGSVCDGYKNCQDGSDEGDCLDRCPPGTSLCADGKECVRTYNTCDGHAHCDDASDEGNCTTEKCGPTRFPCEDGSECLTRGEVCDGNVYTSGCVDGSDETNCTENCPKYERFTCNNTQTCVETWEVCDGRQSCGDGSDESNCTVEKCNIPNSAPWTIPCDDQSTCVMKLQICDGAFDCDDSSDEGKCTQERCGDGRYLCNGCRKCIDVGAICDGKEDCPQGDDEGGCDQQRCQMALSYGPTIRSDFTTCDGGTRCASRFMLCDGRPDSYFCPNGSDDESCDVDECLDAPCQNNGTCVDVKAGYRCDCPSGWSGQNCTSPL